MAQPDRSGSRGRVLLAVAVVVVLAGAGLLVAGLRGQESAPQPRSAGHVPDGSAASHGRPHHDRSGSARPPAGRSEPDRSSQRPLGPSRPTRITIPSIGVDSPVNPIGLAADGTLAVPQPGPHLDEAAWFENSPTPGQLGPAIIEGHVDSTEGPSVFFRLGDLAPGDRIGVRRADGVRLIFRVAAVRDYPKAEFPTEVVYGGDLSRPSLRLITCSDFNPETHHHEGNEVVFARLVSTRGRSADAGA